MTETRGGPPVAYDATSIFAAGDSVSPGVKEATFGDFRTWLRAGLPYEIPFGFADAPTADQVLLIHVFTSAVDFADDFAGSLGDVGTLPTAPTSLDVQVNGVSVGTISISVPGVVSFATTGGALAAVPGDRLEVIAQTVPDATFANAGFTFKGARA